MSEMKVIPYNGHSKLNFYLQVDGVSLASAYDRNDADEIAKQYNFFETHDFAEVERKLKVYETISGWADKIRLTWEEYGYTDQNMAAVLAPNLHKAIEQILELCQTVKPQTTVSDLKPGDEEGRFRFKDKKYNLDAVFMRCAIMASTIPPSREVPVIRLDNGAQYWVPESTPCEIV